MASRKTDGEIFMKEFVDKEEEVLANKKFIEESILFKVEFINSNVESEDKKSISSNSSEFKRLRT